MGRGGLSASTFPESLCCPFTRWIIAARNGALGRFKAEIRTEGNISGTDTEVARASSPWSWVLDAT